MQIRKYRRAIAVFLLLNLLNSVVTPSLLYAGSPTADEYDSFLPAGTTDMVDTRTGDFHYDVPLFDVPGPEGGYPIHLFYNAGIRGEANASWTGLGFNLNVGAITRRVKDIPDDFSNAPYVCKDSIGSYPNYATFLGARYAAYSMAMEEVGNALFQPFSPSGSLRQYGVLHADSASANFDGSTNGLVSFDCHSMYAEDFNDTVRAISPENVDGGSIPSYDEYSVSAEGLTGQIEPIILENGSLFRSSNKGGNLDGDSSSPLYTDAFKSTRSYYKLKSFTQPKQYFRFKNEFSNSFVASSVTPFSYPGDTINFGLTTDRLGYNYTLQSGYSDGFNSGAMRLAGGKHVEYFLNTEITDGTAKAAGFMEYPYYVLEKGGYTPDISERKQLTYLSKTYDVKRRVGGFSITTEEGIIWNL